MGVIGMFCYIGASAQEAISGVLIDAGKSVSTTVWSESAATEGVPSGPWAGPCKCCASG